MSVLNKLSDLFKVRYGTNLELNHLKKTTENQGVPFVSRQMRNNGISAYVELVSKIKPEPSGELTCALGGNGVLTTFIQEKPYYTGRDVACLKPIYEFSKQELLYYCIAIKANRYRYSYGRQANRSLGEILLPSPNEIPSWVHNYDIPIYHVADSSHTHAETLSLNIGTWRVFHLSELFEIKKGKRLTKARFLKGDTPYIGAIDKNNGVSAYIGQSAIHDGNTITVSYNGSVAEAFYQPKPFWATDDVNVLYPKFNLNPYIALFITAIIRKEKYRFNYGRKWHLDRMKSAIIRLPITLDGAPDWDYMEHYIKTLPFSSQIESV